MATKTKKIIFVALALVALVLAALVVRIPTGPNAEEVRNQIEKALPVGSSRERVSEFAKSNGMEQSNYLERERMINAIRRGVSKGLFADSSIYVRFYFDDKNTLQRFTVEEVSTGL
jgi:cell division protein FtsL